MSPILGIWASSIQPSLNATSFDSIATVTVGAGGTNTITFSSIPSTYKHLQIRGILKTARATAGTSNVYITLNGDSTSTYAYHVINGNGATVSATSGTSATAMIPLYAIGSASGYTSSFTGTIIDLLDYTSTTKTKTLRALYGVGTPDNGQLDAGLGSGLWNPATQVAVTSISITPTGATPFQQYSQLALYGIKG